MPNHSNSPFVATSYRSYPTWMDFLVLLVVFLVATLLASLVIYLLQKFTHVSIGLSMFCGYLIQFGATIAFALIQYRKKSGSRAPLLRWRFKTDTITTILWGTVVVTATGVVIEPLIDLMPTSFLEALDEMMAQGGFVMLTAIVLAPLLEEVLFRGIFQGALSMKYSPLVSILLSAGLFGIIHIIPQQVLNAFCIGLVLGYIYYQTQSLIPVIVIHCINNAVAYFLWLINGHQVLSIQAMMDNSQSYWILYVISCVVVLGTFWLMYRSIQDKKPGWGSSLYCARENQEEGSIHQ